MSKKRDLKTIQGQKLREARLKSGKTQTDIAIELKMTLNGYQKYEQNESELKYKTIQSIKKILNCTFDDLLKENEPKDKNENNKEVIK